MASTADESTSAQNGLTPAQRLQQEHESHNPTIEDVPDEEDIAHPPPSASVAPTSNTDTASSVNGGTMSAKAQGKQKATDEPVNEVNGEDTKKKAPALDTASEEAFPSLGPAKAKPMASTWGSRPAAARTNGTTPNNTGFGGPTPMTMPNRTAASMAQRPAQGVSIPGRYVEDMRMPSDQLRNDLKRPIADLLKDINRKSKAKVDMRRGNGTMIFQGQGPSIDSVHEILREVAAQLGQKQQIKVQVPSSLRAFIIGKQGATIQGISKRTGARVQMPKVPAGPEDDEDTVDVEVEGSPMAVAMAKHEIEGIVGQRTATVNLRMKDVPAEFFPFIAGPNNSRISSMEDGRDVRVKVPHYHTWQQQAPSTEHPSKFTAQDGLVIQIAGEREAAKQIQAAIERQIQELQQQLSINQVQIEQSRHQFIVGNRGNTLHDFLKETGCSVVLPPSTEDSEDITIIGPQSQLESALEKAMDLASSMSMQRVDLAKQHPGSREHAEAHARSLGQYLRKRRALEQYEKQYNAQVVPESGSQWQVFSPDARSAMKARTDLMGLVSGHPPARFRNVNIPPFYQRDLQRQHAKPLREQHGVYLMSPEDSESEQVVLVFEGPSSAEDYTFPSKAPSSQDTQDFERRLQEAETLLLSLIGEQQPVEHRSVDAPSKYREKIQRYVARQNQQDTEEKYPVEFIGLDSGNVSGQNFPLNFRGPTSQVDDYEQKIRAFIEEQIRDETERGYTTSFGFPQKFANVLIGRRGENINKLRDEYDVDIQVNDGQVEVKGPQAKANAAKTAILNMGRKLEDETTHVLKIAPKFHSELIGAKGSQVLRLQDRYNVRIQFPRSAADTPDDASDAGAGSRRRNQAADEVVIKGPKKGADEARDELWSLYTYTQDMSHTAVISVAQAQVPSLIGQGGRELQALRESTGAEIDIPGKDSVDANGRVEIKLKGKKASVENAKKIIQERVKVFDDSVSRSVEIDRSHHRALIGRDGDNIRQIVLNAGGSGDARELNRMVQIPKADSSNSAIRVEGSPDIVDRIIAAIESFAQVRDNQVTETVEVAPGRHGALIGRGGETRKAIESEHNVTMQIPSTSVTGPARSMIKLSGAPSDVAAAKERILSMTKETEGVTIDVPHRLHHAVADTNGNIFQSLRRELRVNVDHAGQQKPARPQPPQKTKQAKADMPLITDTTPSAGDSLDPEANHQWDIVDLLAGEDDASGATIPWILRGPDAAALQKAREQIEAAMAQAQDAVTGYLVLPDPRAYRHVIGRGGSEVNRIRQESGARIDVPKAGSGGRDAIEIVGTKSQVEQAKEMVMAAVVQGESARRS